MQLPLTTLLRRPVHARPGSRRRLIGPHPEHPISRLDLVTSAPPRDKGAREGRVGEEDRNGR